MLANCGSNLWNAIPLYLNFHLEYNDLQVALRIAYNALNFWNLHFTIPLHFPKSTLSNNSI